MEVVDNNKKDNKNNYIFVGCMFLGMGIGSLIDSVGTGTGTIIGMGIGFLASGYLNK
jgi:hypothetical protein